MSEMSGNPVADGAAMLDAANSDTGTTNTPPVTPVADNTPPAAPSQQGSGHPAWNQYLKDIPEGFHGVVKPAFEQWDKDVQARLAEVQSRYAPYKDILGSGVQPQQLSEAVRLYQMMANDPQSIYNAMAEHYGYGQDAGQGQAEETDDEFDLGDGEDDISNHPQFRQLQQQQQALQQQQEQFVAAMQQAQEARQQQEEAAVGEQWLDSKVAETTELLKQKGIEPDYDYIITRALALGQSGQATDNDQAWEQAVQSWISKVDSWGNRKTANSTAPLVMPTNGGTPSNQLPDMSNGKSRRQIGAAMLDAAFRNG